MQKTRGKKLKTELIISWFSAGVSSAIATKLALKKYPKIKIIYIHVDDQHSDTMRFIKDCEKWFGQKIEILQSDLKTVENACLKSGFVNSPYGAACTRLLKKRVRKIWEMDYNVKKIYIWGFDLQEKNRADRIEETMSNDKHYFPLIENNILKHEAHGLLKIAGIKRPYMYELGYPNNNCIGCLKGGMGYWNKIRIDFPDVFLKRCEMENKIGNTIFKDKLLSKLDENSGRDQKIILEDCGLFCETLF